MSITDCHQRFGSEELDFDLDRYGTTLDASPIHNPHVFFPQDLDLEYQLNYDVKRLALTQIAETDKDIKTGGACG
jgi:hypothetical protein